MRFGVLGGGWATSRGFTTDSSDPSGATRCIWAPMLTISYEYAVVVLQNQRGRLAVATDWKTKGQRNPPRGLWMKCAYQDGAEREPDLLSADISPLKTDLLLYVRDRIKDSSVESLELLNKVLGAIPPQIAWTACRFVSIDRLPSKTRLVKVKLASLQLRDLPVSGLYHPGPHQPEAFVKVFKRWLVNRGFYFEGFVVHGPLKVAPELHNKITWPEMVTNRWTRSLCPAPVVGLTQWCLRPPSGIDPLPLRRTPAASRALRRERRTDGGTMSLKALRSN